MEFKNCIFCLKNHDNLFVKTETQQGNTCRECFKIFKIQEEEEKLWKVCIVKNI